MNVYYCCLDVERSLVDSKKEIEALQQKITTQSIQLLETKEMNQQLTENMKSI